MYRVYLYTVVIAASFLFQFSAHAKFELPYCADAVCFQTFHNKTLGTANIVVWSGKNTIHSTSSTSLQSDAKLASRWIGDSITSIASESGEIPPAPCSSGVCSTAASETYLTATEIITITITFVYANGELVDIETTIRRTPRPDDRIEE